MLKKSLWFAIVLSLFVVGANFADAKGGGGGGGGGGGRSSFSSGSRVSAPSSSGFSSGSKATAPATSAAPSGFTSGSRSSETPGITSGTRTTEPTSVTGKPDMMSKSVQQERSNSVYNAADKPTGTNSTANAGSLPPSVIGGRTVVKETTVIRDSGRSGGWFPIPIWLGGGGSDHTVIVNNGQPNPGTPGYVEVQSNNMSAYNPQVQHSGHGFWFWLFILVAIAFACWALFRIYTHRP